MTIADPGAPHSVLHVLGPASVAGTAQVRIVAALARALDADRYRLRAWFMDDAGPLVDVLRAAGVPADPVLFHGRNEALGFLRAGQALRRERPEIAHFHVGGRSRMWLFQMLSSAKRVAHLHGDFAEDLTPLRLASTLRRSNATIATSKAIAAAVGSATVIYPGLDVPQSAASLRERPPTIGAVGRLEPIKGFPTLLEAAALLSRRHLEFRLELVGDGTCREALEALAARLGLAGLVAFLGWREDVCALHRRWQVFAQPSLHEGFGLAALEAMASGIPIVASATGGLVELVDDESTGFLVPPGDAEALADRLEQLLRNEDVRLRMGSAARDRVVRRFSARRMAASVATFYDSLLTE